MTQIAQCCLEGDRDKDKALIAKMSKTNWQQQLWSDDY